MHQHPILSKNMTIGIIVPMRQHIYSYRPLYVLVPGKIYEPRVVRHSEAKVKLKINPCCYSIPGSWHLFRRVLTRLIATTIPHDLFNDWVNAFSWYLNRSRWKWVCFVDIRYGDVIGSPTKKLAKYKRGNSCFCSPIFRRLTVISRQTSQPWYMALECFRMQHSHENRISESLSNTSKSCHGVSGYSWNTYTWIQHEKLRHVMNLFLWVFVQEIWR